MFSFKLIQLLSKMLDSRHITSSQLPAMNIIFLTIYTLPYLVNTKPVSKSIEEKHVEDISYTRDMSNSMEKECERKSECIKIDINNIRNMRHADENTTQPNIAKLKQPVISKEVLVKKPIPKFIDTGSDEDYQTKMRIPNEVSDTFEHEDEDFSIDDYEFDLNHDEFAGRGKPLEPRVKSKGIRQEKPTPAKVEQPLPVPALNQNKVVLPLSNHKPSIKVARHAAAAGVMKEEEYDEEFTAVTTSPENQKKIEKYRENNLSTSPVSEESEDSRQEEAMRPMRATRSSPSFNVGAYVDKLGEKTSVIFTRMLTHLPLFPQRYVLQEKIRDYDNNENAPIESLGLGTSVS